MKSTTVKKSKGKNQKPRELTAKKPRGEKPSQAQREALRFLASGFMIQSPIAGATVMLSGYNAGTGQGTISVRVLRTGGGPHAFLARFDDALVGDLPAAIPGALPP